jgi:hypothetical protein
MQETITSCVWAGLVLTLFFIFAGLGWPGAMDSCVTENKAKTPSITENGCYCEPFSISDVKNHVPGFRQPFNTFSNLYVLGTGAFLTFIAWKQRKLREKLKNIPTTDKNRFRRTDLFPIYYIQVVIFLGLGSMWFHASIVSWGGLFDQMSMYALVTFLLAYSLMRLLGDGKLETLGFLFTYWAILLILYFPLAWFQIPSVLVIAISMIPYGIMEFLIWLFDWALDKENKQSFWVYWRYWIIGFVLFMIAIVVRGQSETGKALCISCSSAFQYHGVWHVLSGGMAVLLYFHWVKARKR